MTAAFQRPAFSDMGSRFGRLLSDTLFLGSLLRKRLSQELRSVRVQEMIGKQLRRFSIAINRVLSVPVSEVGVMRSLLVLLGLLYFAASL